MNGLKIDAGRTAIKLFFNASFFSFQVIKFTTCYINKCCQEFVSFIFLGIKLLSGNHALPSHTHSLSPPLSLSSQTEIWWDLKKVCCISLFISVHNQKKMRFAYYHLIRKCRKPIYEHLLWFANQILIFIDNFGWFPFALRIGNFSLKKKNEFNSFGCL